MACAIVGAFVSANAAQYVIRDLGPLDGHVYGAAYAINESGQIAGRSGSHIVLWEVNGAPKDYCIIPEGSTGDPLAIDKSGHIVGRLLNERTGVEQAVTCSGDGFAKELGSFGGRIGEACGINDNGWIVGFSAEKSGSEKAFLWQKEAGLIQLAMIKGARRSAAYDINSSAQIAGYCGNSAVIWSKDGKVKDLGTLKGTIRSIAWGINGKGVTCGEAVDEEGNRHAWVCKPGAGMTELELLPGWSEASARKINDSGIVVGWVRNQSKSPVEGDAKYRAVAWDESGKVIDLGVLPKGTLSQAMGVNNAGVIVGRATAPDGKSHAVAWVIK